MFYGMAASGMWQDERGVNLLDSGAYFYDTYETKDGKWIAIGRSSRNSIASFSTGSASPISMQASRWTAKLARIQIEGCCSDKGEDADEWDAALLGTDACYAPVLSLKEAPAHPHNIERQTSPKLTEWCSRRRRPASVEPRQRCRGRRKLRKASWCCPTGIFQC